MKTKQWCKDWHADRVGEHAIQEMDLVELGVFQKLWWYAAHSWSNHGIPDGRVYTGTKYWQEKHMLAQLQKQFPKDAKRVAPAFKKMKAAGYISRNKSGHLVHDLFARCQGPMSDQQRKSYQRRQERRDQREAMGPPPADPPEDQPQQQAQQQGHNQAQQQAGGDTGILRNFAGKSRNGTFDNVISYDFTGSSGPPGVSQVVTQEQEVEQDLSIYLEREEEVEPRASAQAPARRGPSPESRTVNPPAAPSAPPASAPPAPGASTIYDANTEREREREPTSPGERERNPTSRSEQRGADPGGAAPTRERERERDAGQPAQSQNLRSTAPGAGGADAGGADGAAGGRVLAQSPESNRGGSAADHGTVPGPLAGAVPKEPEAEQAGFGGIYDMDPIEAAVTITGEGSTAQRALWRKYYGQLGAGLFWAAVGELKEALELGKCKPGERGKLLNFIMGRMGKARRPGGKAPRE